MPTKSKPSRRTIRLQLVFSALVLLMGLTLMVCGFFVPPIGEIHPSVLVGFGEALSFVGAVIGVDYHYKAKAIK